MIELTTVARVKAYAKTVLGSDHDDKIAHLITMVSDHFEGFLNRKFEKKSRVAYLSVDRDDRTFFSLDAYPVSSIDSVYYDPTRQFGAATLLDTSKYFMEADDSHYLRIVDTNLVEAPRVLKITYTGGLAEDTTGLIADFPGLAGAADMQIAYLFSMSGMETIESVSIDGATTRTSPPLALHPYVKQLLELKYQRVVV